MALYTERLPASTFPLQSKISPRVPVSFKYVAEDCTASSSNVLPSKSCHWASRPIYKRKTAASITPQKI